MKDEGNGHRDRPGEDPFSGESQSDSFSTRESNAAFENHGEADTHVPRPGESLPSAARGPGDDPAALPAAIGPYVVLGKLGEGGMGLVYEAEQQQPRRRVAVKVVRGGHLVDEDRVRMFRREVETLARLKHPNIGAIYESGCTEDGQHFFAMELVRGPTLDEYLEQRPRTFSRRELDLRLKLFLKIADAVHHAHQRGVIHRDLKPSNIIVIEPLDTEDSSSSLSPGSRGPDVKILDFGLARITDADVAAATMATEIGVIKGTLPYMSPEQARGNPDEIDLRSDVYALGVILYEMIAGVRPYDTARTSIVEAVRIICEEPPRALTMTWSGTRKPDEDLRTIVGKSLEKEADRRYGSAAALSEDVGRYLTSQPILARPPSTVYQLRKFARRNKVLVGGMLTTVLALAVGFVFSTVMYVRAEREAEHARTKAEESEQVATFLTEMLAGVGPQVAQGRDTTILREILDQTAERVGAELGEQPEVEAVIRSTIGGTFMELGEFESAEENLRRSLELYRQLHGENHGDVARGLNDVGLTLHLRGEDEAAEPLMLQAVEVARGVHGDQHLDTALYATNLANMLVAREKFDEAEPLLREALATRREILDTEHEEIATSLNSLANLLHHKGELDEAETLYGEALAMHRSTLGERHPFVATDMQNLAYLMRSKGDLNASEAQFRESLDLHREIYEGGHPRTAEVLGALSDVLRMKGAFDEAETMLRESLEIQRSSLGEESADIARTLDRIGLLLSAKGDHEGSLVPIREALALRRKLFGERSIAVASSLNNLADGLRRLDRFEEAEPLMRDSLEIDREIQGDRDPGVLLKMNNLARLLGDKGEEEAAAEMFRGTLDLRLEILGETHNHVGTTKSDLGTLLLGMGELDEAERLLRSAVSIYEANLGTDHLATASCKNNLGRVLFEKGELGEAETLQRDVLAFLIKQFGPTSRQTAAGEAELARTLALGSRQKQRDEAETLFKKVLKRGDGVLSTNRRARVMRYYGESLTRWKRYAEAESQLSRSYEIVARARGAGHPSSRRYAGKLADLYEAWASADPAGAHAAKAKAWRAIADR